MKTTNICAILGNVPRFDGLLPLTENRPLDTLPFDCKYRLIDFPLSSIANANVHSMFMVFNEGETRSLFDHIGGGKEWNLDSVQNSFFIYFHQDFLKQKKEGLPYYASIIDYLEKSEAEYTIFMGSNMLCTVDVLDVLTFHEQKKNQLTIVYKKMSRDAVTEKDYVLNITNDHIAQGAHPFKEEAVADKLNLCMDIYFVQTKWLIEQLEIGQLNDSPINIQKYLRTKIGEIETSAYEYTGYLGNIYDVGSYFKANMDMLDPEKFNSLLYTNQKIYTKLKNEVPTYYSENSTIKNSQCATGCIIEGSLENSLVSRRTKVKKDASINHAMIMSNATIGEGAKIDYAILDKNVTVEAGVTICGTPEYPVIIEKGQTVSMDVLGGMDE